MIEEQNLGEITNVKGLVFNKYNRVDHASLTGRPCIVLDVVDLYAYVIPLSSKENYLEFPGVNIKVEKNDLFRIRGLSKTENASSASLYEIIERKMCFYEPLAQLKPEAYYNLLIKLLSIDLSCYPETYKNFEIIKEDLLLQKEMLEKRFEKAKQKKENNIKRVRKIEQKNNNS